MYPVARDHVSADEAAPGALKNCCNKTFFFFLSEIQPLSPVLLITSSPCFPQWACLQSLASLSVPFPGSCLLCCLNCQPAGLIYLCSSPFSCRNAAALKTSAGCCLLFLLHIVYHQGSRRSPPCSSRHHPVAAFVYVSPHARFQGLGTRFCLLFKAGSKQGKPEGSWKCCCLLGIISQAAVSVTSLRVLGHFVCQVHVTFGLLVALSSFKYKEVISLEYARPELMFWAIWQLRNTCFWPELNLKKQMYKKYESKSTCVSSPCLIQL